MSKADEKRKTPNMLKALTLSGSTRAGSANFALSRLMGAKLAALGAHVDNINLHDYPLPLFDADLEKAQGEPENALKLAEMFAAADIIFIASPEYNNSLSPLLKNTIDWISRQKNNPYKRAIFGMGSVSSGQLSGVVCLSHLRDILAKLGALMAPTSLSVGNAQTAFDDDGELSNPVQQARSNQLAEQLMTISRRG